MVRSHLRLIALAAFLVSAVTPQHSLIAAQALPERKLTVERLGEGIYLFRAPAALDRWTATNSVVIVNEADVTVFDSFTRAETARMAIAEIKALTAKPVRTLINSHWHMDHWRGNHEFATAFPGLDIITTVETRDYMRRMSNGFLIDSTRANVVRLREALTTAIATGRQADGSPLTADARRAQESEIEASVRFADEMTTVPRVLPNVAFRKELTFWRGAREFRLLSMTGDATESAVLYLPAEKIVITGDVLVSPPDGDGPPPWTTNSYAIRPWLESLTRLDALDAAVIVPGQGPAMRDERYLQLTVELFAAIVAQVDRALERGVFKTDEVIAQVDLDAIGRRYPGGRVGAGTPFSRMTAGLIRKATQEALDGVVR